MLTFDFLNAIPDEVAPPFVVSERWAFVLMVAGGFSRGKLCGTLAKRPPTHASVVPTLRKPRSVGQPLSW